jgi:hypothetical protein
LNETTLRILRALLSALALTLCWPVADAGALRAQRVLGGPEDAVTVPRGSLRIGIGGEHTTFRDRWRDGRLESLGGGFSFPALGPSRLAVLAPVEADIRALGLPDFAASLGATELDLRQRMFVTPFSLELGITDWLSVGAVAPLVRVRSEAQLRLDASSATLGPNPYFAGSGVPGSNLATIGRFRAASTSLSARRDGCIANPASAPECPTILAEAAAVDALIAGSTAFAGGLERTYGAQGGPAPSAYVPLAGSPTENALLERVSTMRDAFTRYGVTDITPATSLPLGAQVPLTIGDLRALVRDSTAGWGARPLSSSSRINIGDVDVGVKVKLLDSFGGKSSGATGERLRADRFGIRQSLGLTYRIGSGIPGAPGDFLDLGTGTGEDAWGVRSYTDLVVNDRFWSTIMLGFAQATGEPAVIRVPTVTGDQLLESWREVFAPVKRGSVMQVEVAPRYHLSDYVAFGGYWGWRKRHADRYTVPSVAVAAPPAAGVVPLDSIGMSEAFASDEQRAGFSLTFSTLAARAAGRAKGQLEITFSHRQSITSGSGIVPKRWEDRVELRYYTRLFGR